jgi:hypothetical protein
VPPGTGKGLSGLSGTGRRARADPAAWRHAACTVKVMDHVRPGDRVWFSAVYIGLLFDRWDLYGASQAQLSRYIRASGHEGLNGKYVQVTIYRDPDRVPPGVGAPRFSPPFQVAAHATASVPRVPLRYPMCGDWACYDEFDWDEADPATQPDVYAGVAAEKRFLKGFEHPGGWYMGLWDEALARRREQASGRPLWTIDLRPEPVTWL